jgi:peptidoglycan/LPS O-acetylase OafA/YrhL
MLLPRQELTKEPLRRDRSDGIDALRALLAIWVMLAHLVSWVATVQGPAAEPGWLQAVMGYVLRLFQPVGELHPGVLAFIVLSGYCIHRAGLRENGSGQLAGYAIRLFFRIAPIYYIATCAGLIGIIVAGWKSPSFAAMLSGTTTIDSSCVAAKMLFLPAVYSGVYQCSYLGNAPLATVVVEVVLYVIYAAAFAGLVWRRLERAVWLTCLGLFIATLIMLGRGVSPGFYGWWQNGSVFSFLPYWWLGVAFVNPEFAENWARRIWPLAAAWLVLSALLLWTHAHGALGLAELRKLIFAIGVGVFIHRLDRRQWRGLAILAPVGRAGYGLYALHAPVTYTLVIYGAPWWSILLTNLALCLVVHHLIERPLAGWGRILRERVVAPPLPVPAEGVM